ncbi:hypothetical protein [Pseudomonas sp. NPDC086251]|jgi:hypothetical protein|uniref:hypothetical protein n=1 Tax=Pseudomonas sp. NPDC086251 TaxID=3364431 RepID=UPI0038352DE6
MIYPQRPALCQSQGSRSKAVGITGKEGKAVKIRPGRQKDSGAPTPTGVCLDDLIQKFADDQHGEGLIYTSWHSNLAGQGVQYGAIHARETIGKFAPNGNWLYIFWHRRFVH